MVIAEPTDLALSTTPKLPDAPPWPDRLVADLRTDHAGETGAVMIYRGILASTRDPILKSFAQGHLATEAAHLAAIELLLAPRHRRRAPICAQVFRRLNFLFGFVDLAGRRRSSPDAGRLFWRLAQWRKIRLPLSRPNKNKFGANRVFPSLFGCACG